MTHVSFIMIAYNEEKSIAAALQSIIAQQHNQPFEVIVVNDGSQDGTARAVQHIAATNPEVHLVTQENAGRGAARARGIAAARGAYIAFIDADIILPRHWLATCLRAMKRYDAVGGIAVPDGDVAYVHRFFGLIPKPIRPTATITGNNGFFKRAVFDQVAYNRTKKDGEDVDMAHQLTAAGFASATLADLLVEHRESKTYVQSLAWLFVSGRGASRQLYEYRQLRVPDMAFGGFLMLAAGVLMVSVGFKSFAPLVFILLCLYLISTSIMHLHGRFLLSKMPIKALQAIFVNTTFMLAYYLGRTEGLLSQLRHI